MRASLDKLTAAEIIFRRGTLPDARYTFKHALVQDAAYQSILKSRRQEVHTRIAETLEERFPETVKAEPELLAHHYTGARLVERVIEYWQKAGERAIRRSANVEAIEHLKKGLELLESLPDTAERARRELPLQITLGPALMAVRGQGAPGATEEAGVCFRHSLDAARGQRAKSLELRAATSLARLWADQGKPTETHDVLAPVYGWFTEGFDTTDLKDATALLKELR